jgi:hypothetical protein
MGQKFTITESERNEIRDLYEQQSTTQKQDVSKLFTPQELENGSRFKFEKDHFNNNLTIYTFLSGINKEIVGNNSTYTLMLRSGGTYENRGVYLLFTDGTRLNKPNAYVGRENGFLNNLTQNELVLLKTKKIKYYKVGGRQYEMDDEESTRLIVDLSAVIKINRNNFDLVQKLFNQEETSQNEPIEPIQSVNPTIDNKEDEIHTAVQIPAEFPGGQSGWVKYLDRTLNKDIPVKNGAPPGKYTVIVSFIVSRSGDISEVQAQNDPGYGTKEEAIRVIEKGPSWKPAVQNGRNVIHRHRQAIVFMVSEN